MKYDLVNYRTPLKLTPFGIKAFEDSLSHTTVEPRSVMVAEYHSTLMNVIIQDRMDGLVKPVLAATGSTTAGSINNLREDRESSVMTDNSTMDDGDLSIADQDDYVHHERRKLAQRPINEQVVVVGQGWDAKLVPSSRDGWEAVLVGLINEVS